MNRIEHTSLSPTATLREALNALNNTGPNLTVFVVDGAGRLLGTVTDGDVRRALIAGRDLDSPVSGAMNSSPRHLVIGRAPERPLKALRQAGIRLLPEVDEEGTLLRVLDISGSQAILPVHALLMAGGRGSRLRPITDTLPKPLVPVHGRPIIEHILGLLGRFGVEDVSVSVNYLKEKIQDHLGDGSRFGARIDYLVEQEPLGTAGALRLLERPAHDVVLLMNGDLLTDVDLEGMFQLFTRSRAAMAVATTEHHVDLPYAVMDLEGDLVLGYREKPTVSFPCNAGIYLLRSEWRELVPEHGPFHATDLIQALLDRGERVVAFPIEGTWYDIGRYEDLERARPANAVDGTGRQAAQSGSTRPLSGT